MGSCTVRCRSMALPKTTTFCEMKAILLFGLAVLVLSLAHGQPLVNFNNGPGSDNGPGGVLRSPIYAPPINPDRTNFNTPAVIPTPGTREFTGALLAGPGYTAELWGGSFGSTEDSLVPLGATTFRTGQAAGFVVPVQLRVLTIPPGERATFQVRAWDNVGMTVTNWTQAASGRFGAFGSSALFSPDAVLGGTPLDLIGLTSFELAIPEPSTWALLVAGTFAFWMLGRPRRMA